MTLTILISLGLPLGVVVVASLAGALLAPRDFPGRCAMLRSQWSTRQTRITASECRPGTP
jgi:hypothetical protein